MIEDTTVPATLRLGSNGATVKRWQSIIKLPESGNFDGKTAEVTKNYQRIHGLAADGIVGPATWRFALKLPAPPVAKNSSAATDQWAYEVSKRALPNLSEAERQYALAVARGEGFYGKGWTGAGVGSNNWGAVQGTGDAGSFQHLDHHADGTPYTTAFKRYSTPEKGFADMAAILLKPNVKAALAKGNLHDAVFSQHANRYFELAPEKYLEAVQRNYAQLTANMGWKELLSLAGAGVAGVVIGAVVMALGLGAIAWLRSRSG